MTGGDLKWAFAPSISNITTGKYRKYSQIKCLTWLLIWELNLSCRSINLPLCKRCMCMWNKTFTVVSAGSLYPWLQPQHYMALIFNTSLTGCQDLLYGSRETKIMDIDLKSEFILLALGGADNLNVPLVGLHRTRGKELYWPINKHQIWINKLAGQCCLEMLAINLQGPPSSSLNYKESASRETLTVKRHTGC